MAVTIDQLEQLYLAYFGRPADFGGVAFYTAQPNIDIWDVAASFGTSAESQALYGSGFSPAVINAIYQNLFNRDADPAGLLYWSQVVARGDLSPAGAALAILQGAQNEDAQAIANKLAAAKAFTEALDTSPEILGYAGQNAAALARAQLHAVTSDNSTLTAYISSLDAEVAAVVGVGGTIGKTVALTTGVDTVDFSSNSTTIDTVKGVIDNSGLPGAFGSGTYTAGDSIIGNGKTIVDLAITNGFNLGLPIGGQAPFATIKNATVNFTVASSGNISVDASSWSNISTVNLAAGGGANKTIDLHVNSLNSSAGLSIAKGVGGTSTASTLGATFTNGNQAALYSTKSGSINVAGNLGAVVGTMAASDAQVGFSAWAAAGKSLSIGDVKIASNSGVTGSGAWLSVYQTSANNVGGDISVGNVTLSAKDVWLTIESTGHTAASPAGNVSVGNIDITVAASGELENVNVENISTTGKVGNLTVGDVTVVMGSSAVSGSSVAFYDYGVGTAGNLTVGNVTLSMGTGSEITDGFHFENYATHNSKGAATVGNLSIGNLSVDVAQSGSIEEFNITHYATATGAGNATVGTTNIGAISLTLAQSAAMSFSTTWDIHANAYGAGNATVGDITIGAESINLGLNVELSNHNIKGSASVANTGATTAAATLGNVTVGDISLTLGIGASVSELYRSFDATGSSISSVGNVSFGNVSVNGDDGAKLGDLYMHAGSSGKVGNVSFGNIEMSAGVSGDLYASGDVTASNSIGTVSIGSIDLTGKANSTVSAEYFIQGTKAVGNVTAGGVTLVGATNAEMFAYHSITAGASGTIGTVTIGDISVTGVTNTGTNNVGYEMYVAAGKTVGDVTVGNVTVVASGSSTNSSWDAYAEFYVEGKGGTGALGKLTIGNVDLTVNGTGMTGAFSATLGANAATAGTLTVGNIDITLGAAKATDQEAYVNVYNYHGDAVVGDITINGAIRGTKDATMTYSADVNVGSATGNVKVGNITVVGDGKGEDLGNLSFLHLTNGGGTKTTTIGNVDYSGYKAATTIDVSAFKGAANIVGTAKGDTIVDNAGTNTITGGAGADLFHFLNPNFTDANGGYNKNLTVATVDTITDFNEAQGDRIDVGTGTLSATPGSATYGEGTTTYADLTAVITAAKAAEANGVKVFVGQVGTDSYVVVDEAGDGTPDFAIKLVGVNYAHIDVSAFV